MDPAAENSSSQSLQKETSPSEEEELSTALTANYQSVFSVHHGFFKWSIENFSRFPLREDKHVISPVFVLRNTWWTLVLHPKAKSFGRDVIALNLIRNSKDLGPRCVVVSYRLGLQNGGNKIWFKAEESALFGRGDCRGFQTSIFEHLQDFMSEGVQEHASPNGGRNRTKYLSLSSSLITLFKSGQSTDLLIEIPPRHYIKAHKCVLSARSTTLARMLEDGKSFIQLSCSASCLNCVLLYVYSGSFDFLSTNAEFTIGLYEIACYLSLSSLSEMLIPNKSEVKSRLVTEVFRNTFTFEKFQLGDITEDFRDSPVQSENEKGMSVKLRLHRMSPDYVAVRIEVCGIGEALDFTLKVSLVNKNCDPIETVSTTSFRDLDAVFRNSVYSFNLRFSVKDILRCLSDGNLLINCVCKRYSLKELPDMSAHFICFPDESSAWVEELSTDLKKLHETGALSDVTLVVSGESFKAHRAILTARSNFFRELFLYDHLKNTVVLAQVDARITNLMLKFLYCGEISKRISKEDLTKLYEAAEELSIKSLVKICCKYLTLKFDRKFVFNVMSLADKYENPYLRRECMKFINYTFSAEELDLSSDEISEDDDLFM